MDKSEKSIFFKYIIFLLVFSSLAALSLFEIIVEPNTSIQIPFHNVLYPYVEFRPPANVTWHSQEPSPSSRKGEYAVEYSNNDSFRIPSANYKIEKNKPENQIRIAIIGGSTVRIGTLYEVTLPGALKRKLKQRYPTTNIEVINAGITSAISRQELILLITSLVDYQLDILIIYDGINDSGQMLYYEQRVNFPYNYQIIERSWQQYISGIRNSLWKELISRSELLTMIWPEKFEHANNLNTIPAEQLIEDTNLRQSFASAHTDNWEKINQVCKAYNIKPIFVLQPTSLYPTFADGRLKNNTSTNLNKTLFANYLIYEAFRKTIKAFSDKTPGTQILDLSSALPQNAFYDGAHVYDEINDNIAEMLMNSVNKEIDVIQYTQGKQEIVKESVIEH